MSRSLLISIFIVAIIAVTALFVLSYVSNQSEPVSSDSDASIPDQRVEDTENEQQQRIIAKHFYSDGVHTLVGEIDMPTPCDLLDHEVMVQESMPEQVQINFNVINNSETCAQVVTAQRFMVEVEASEEATFTATLRNNPVSLNLVPAAPDESPNEFELFIKG